MGDGLWQKKSMQNLIAHLSGWLYVQQNTWMQYP